MTFQEIDKLRRLLRSISELHVESLERYFDSTSGGFSHQVDERKLSKASTATCVLSLVSSNRWYAQPPMIYRWQTMSSDLAVALLTEKWASAGLPPNNLFTTAFVLECVTDLEGVFPPGAPTLASDVALQKRITAAEKALLKGTRPGYAQILNYPASAYVTQLVVRTLCKRKLLSRMKGDVLGWARAEIANQLALAHAHSKTADPFQLGYAIVLVAMLEVPSKTNPDHARILNAALQSFFEAQLPDGSWPRSRPLFHYRDVGSAYCYEYELLVQMIESFQTAGRDDRLLPFLPKFSVAAQALRPTSYRLGENALGWSSGHHPQLEGPESWSTASAYHFAYALDRLLAEAIRQVTFEHLDGVYTPPRSPKNDPKDFAHGFLDSTFSFKGETYSLRNTVFKGFVERVASNEGAIQTGGSLPEDVPSSMIIFGPPGTAKTELAKIIADYLGWPRLTVDPSHLVRNGLDQVQAEANTVFGLLASAERIVVLFDEFDEMVRERQGTPDVLSRFLTTSMLPKLAAINKQRKIVFIVATNHIDHFDLAISRTGRFDLILPLLPPTADEKLKKWPDVESRLTNDFPLTTAHVRKLVEPLTFDEFKQLRERVLRARTQDEADTVLTSAWETCTWHSTQAGDGSQTWEIAITAEIDKRARLGPQF